MPTWGDSRRAARWTLDASQRGRLRVSLLAVHRVEAVEGVTLILQDRSPSRMLLNAVPDQYQSVMDMSVRVALEREGRNERGGWLHPFISVPCVRKVGASGLKGGLVDGRVGLTAPLMAPCHKPTWTSWRSHNTGSSSKRSSSRPIKEFIPRPGGVGTSFTTERASSSCRPGESGVDPPWGF